jgi:penicillin-binding protein 1B
VAIGEYRWDGGEWTVGKRPFRFLSGPDSGGVVRVELEGNRVTGISEASGSPLADLTLEPEVIATVRGQDPSDRVPVTLDRVPKALLDAILTVEDQDFFQHKGLSFRRIAGAMVADLKAGRPAQGGSTITQQLARTMWLSGRRTVWRKIREAALAVGLEARYSKTEILRAYLNEVYLGQDGALAIRGVGRAAQFYFGKDIADLDLAESALIAGIIRGPNLYLPFRNERSSLERRNVVLDLMHAKKVIPDGAYRAAQREGLRLRRRPEPARSGRYFVDWVMQGLPSEQAGLSVYTTLDPLLQRVAEDAMARGLARLEQARPQLVRPDHPLEGALVALDPRTGEVLALVGGRDYAVSQFDRAIHAHRQPGSAFKPVVALAALTPDDSSDTGQPLPAYTLASQVDDDTLIMETSEGEWRPANYDSSYRGPVTLRTALERSLNVPFARLGLDVGPKRIAETAHLLGVESRLVPVPSLALGASDVSLLELVRAYGVLAANGYRASTVSRLGVLDARGNALEHAEVRGEQVVPPSVAYLLTSALQGVVERGTARGVRGLGFAAPVAAKTGTTNDLRDAWLVGYTPRLALGVWVGFDDGRNVGLTGAGAALPVFTDFLKNAARDDGDFTVPEGVVFADAGPECEREVFLAGTVPDGDCVPHWFALRPVREGLKAFFHGLRRLFGGGRDDTPRDSTR